MLISNIRQLSNHPASKVGLYAGLLVLVLMVLPHSANWFKALFPEVRTPVYDRQTFLSLTVAHIKLVGISSLLTVIIGVGASIIVTRWWGKEFKPMLSSLAAIGQTFPPAAVLALAVPVVGFGFSPALLALVLYGLLPIIENSIKAFTQLPTATMMAARGLGMNGWQQLRQVEFPLAFPVILAGIRTSVMINIGTATIASTVGTQSLGTPIIAGLINYNLAFVLQGVMLVALLALLTDSVFDWLQSFSLTRTKNSTKNTTSANTST